MSPLRLITNPIPWSAQSEWVVDQRATEAVPVQTRAFLPRRRPGFILVLFAVLVPVIFVFVAMAVDVGYLCVIRTELQRGADAGALAGATGLYAVPEATEMKAYDLPPEYSAARRLAQQTGTSNSVSRTDTKRAFSIDENIKNDPEGDIVIGRLNDPSNMLEPLTVITEVPNTVLVRASMTDSHTNGPVPLFFARAIGLHTANVSVSAMATIDHPRLLPFTTSEDKWKSLRADGGDGDNYTYRGGSVTKGRDGVPEIKVFPNDHWDGTGMPPGNFGALQIGPKSGTDVLRRQIDMGPTPSDMGHHGGVLAGPIEISGQTGIKGDITTALTGGSADGRQYPGIIGDARYMGLYTSVAGNGSNALFVISRFVSVRVMDARLTGNPKWILVQPVTKVKDLVNVRLTR